MDVGAIQCAEERLSKDRSRSTDQAQLGFPWKVDSSRSVFRIHELDLVFRMHVLVDLLADDSRGCPKPIDVEHVSAASAHAV